jgi:malonyl-CoA O-methyltransferase
MFDRMAEEWDVTRVTPQHMVALDAALDRVQAPPKRVLDLGTGSGAAARLMVARWPDAQVTGVDLSEQMVRQARARATSERERYLAADASSLPFADGSFDLVALLNMIPFFDELRRVTAPGGTLVLAFSRGPQTPIWVPFERLRSELERRGFRSFQEIDAAPGRSLVAVREELS